MAAGDFYSEILRLPLLVESQIFQNLKGKDILNCRLVCKQWNQAIETDTGLKVVLDDRIPGNLNFIHKIVYENLTIQHLRNNASLYPVMHCSSSLPRVYNLKLVGRIYPKILMKILHLPQFLHLESLDIRQTVLWDKLHVNAPMNFPCLQRLRLSMIPIEATLDTCVKNLYPEKSPKFQSRIAQNTVTNVKNILLHFSSPSLRDLCIDGFVRDRGDETMHGWKNEPLRTFLAKHKNTMKKLILDGRGHDQGHYDLIPGQKLGEFDFPQELERLEFVFHGTHLETNPWAQLVKNQRHLKTLHMDIVCDQTHSIECLQIFFPQSVVLQNISIGWGFAVNLDFKIFEVFRLLRKLDLFYDLYDGEFQEASNLKALASLKHLKLLYLSNIYIPRVEDLQCLLALRNLDYLLLSMEEVDFTHLTCILKAPKLFDKESEVFFIGEDPEGFIRDVCPCCAIDLDF